MQRGFSLLGLTLLMTFLVTILALGLFMLNPKKKYAMENNEKRSQDIQLYVNSLRAYITDHPGNLPQNISIVPKEINASGVNLCSILIPNYMTTMPVDP